MSIERKVYTTRADNQRASLKLTSFSDGTTQIESYQELELYMSDCPQLLEAIAIPVLQVKTIDWYSKHRDLKLLNEFEREDQKKIKQRVDALLNSGIQSGGRQQKKIEFIESLVSNSIILSNGQNDTLIWGYEQKKPEERQDDAITLHKLKTETQKRRNEQGGALGKLTVSLIWDTDDDLDLHVIEPDGEDIGPTKKTSNSGGKLDVDANYNSVMKNPVENIFWQEPPKGTYRVMVNCYNRRSTKDGQIPFEVLVLDEIHGEHRSYKDSISSTRLLEELPFQIHI